MKQIIELFAFRTDHAPYSDKAIIPLSLTKLRAAVGVLFYFSPTACLPPSGLVCCHCSPTLLLLSHSHPSCPSECHRGALQPPLPNRLLPSKSAQPSRARGPPNQGLGTTVRTPLQKGHEYSGMRYILTSSLTGWRITPQTVKSSSLTHRMMRAKKTGRVALQRAQSRSFTQRWPSTFSLSTQIPRFVLR